MALLWKSLIFNANHEIIYPTNVGLDETRWKYFAYIMDSLKIFWFILSGNINKS